MSFLPLLARTPRRHSPQEHLSHPTMDHAYRICCGSFLHCDGSFGSRDAGGTLFSTLAFFAAGFVLLAVLFF